MEVKGSRQSPAGTHAGSSRISVWKVGAVICLVLAILLPRVTALDRLVTPDETRWLTRSGNFYYALTHRDFGATYQIEHPGVLIMWAGMFAFLREYASYREQAPGQLHWLQDEIGGFLRSHGHQPLDLLVASRLNMILLIAAALLAAFWAASRLFGFWPAIIGFLLLALDPFYTALSRLLHVDGLSSTLVFLSVLEFLNYLYHGKQPRDLILAGVAAGLAWLTKSPALFLIPFTGLLLLIELMERWLRHKQFVWRDVWRSGLAFVLWGSVGLAVFVLLWPAMWVEPIHTLRRMLGGMIGYAVEGHDAPLYFNGKVFSGDPGFSFYPVTYLWRATPVVLIGLAFASIVILSIRKRSIGSAERRSLAMLLLFAVLFTLFMDFGAKKFDRYLLPVYLPLDLVAGVGWTAAAIWFREQQARPSLHAASPLVLLVACIAQAAGTVSTYPYYLSYYNPLLGGTPRAPKVMMVGWGEGLDQAARFLNRRPDADQRQVATGVWTTTFSYFYHGPVLRSRFEPGTSRIDDWLSSDYYVLYINETQRDKVGRDLVDYFATQQPIQVVRINGLDYVYVYDIRDVPPPDFMLRAGPDPRTVMNGGSTDSSGETK